MTARIIARIAESDSAATGAALATLKELLPNSFVEVQYLRNDNVKRPDVSAVFKPVILSQSTTLST